MGNSWIIAILVATECTDVGLNTLAKAATRQGMSEFVFVVYSSALALLFLLPSTFVFHRIFVLGLLSVIGAAVIAVGFYAVLWGKAKEEKDVKDHVVLMNPVTESLFCKIQVFMNKVAGFKSTQIEILTVKVL